ncbi:Uncharacterised protein [Kluyvera cryocrescens]|uniref:Uncharacterized protein n=1 Tax=Kluyvera cryocrescens TaxID=580 RepID=A0A485BAX4_KLUCR|nr:Uncharacterised protein [Kluyvera cryocrescens]
MVLELSDWLPPLSRLVKDESEEPPLCVLLPPLSCVAALLRSCNDTAPAAVETNALAMITRQSIDFTDFMDGLVCASKS